MKKNGKLSLAFCPIALVPISSLPLTGNWKSVARMIQYIPFAVLAFYWVGAIFQVPTLYLPPIISRLTYHPVPGAISQIQVRGIGVIPARFLTQTIIAVDDEYTTNQGEMLSVTSPGVMANDSRVEGASAVLIDPATHMEVTLNPNGSFTYTPAAGFIGVYTFEYHLELGSQISEPALVQITVLDTQPPDVNWISPVSDGEIQFVWFESILLEAEATDNGPVAGVHFYRWDAELETYVDIAFVETAPYQFLLDTKELNPTWNELFVRAQDEAGNISERQSILVYLIPRLFLPVLLR